MWNDPRWKARLKAANDAAIARGVFGAPFFIVDGEPFWGNDRRAPDRALAREGAVLNGAGGGGRRENALFAR